MSRICKWHACSCLLHGSIFFFFSFSCLFILFFLFAIWSSTIGPTSFLFRNLDFFSIRSISWRKKETDTPMELKRVEKKQKKEEDENMCTALLTALIVLSMACLKHFSSVSYLIEQWRSLVFLLLNIVLLAVYFTSTRPTSSESHDFKNRRLRMMQGKKKKKNKTRMVMEPDQDFLVVEPNEVIKNCVLEEKKRVCLFNKKMTDFSRENNEFEPGRLSNEELDERVEAFIKTFRQHLVLDARRGRDKETYKKIRAKDSNIRFFSRDVTCSV